MTRKLITSSLLVTTWLATLVTACSASSSDSAATGDDQNIESGANIDVQALHAESSGAGFFLGGASTNDCAFSNIKSTGGNRGEAVADCTDVMMKAAQRPAFSAYIEPLAWLVFQPGTQTVASTAYRHWCGRVNLTVAVKAAAWDAPSFEGIGFFATETMLGTPKDRETTFYDKGDPRLVRTGEATLKNGEHAYLYEFVGAGPCEVSGDGSQPSQTFTFKPYVQYTGGIQRWEAVAANHGIEINQSWNRSSDLLQ